MSSFISLLNNIKKANAKIFYIFVPMLKRIILFIALVPLIAFSETSYVPVQHKSLLHKTYTQRSVELILYYENFIRDSDSVAIFSDIAAIRKLAIENGDDALVLETELMQVHYFYYRYDRFPAEMVTTMLDSLRKTAIEKKIAWLEARVENLLGLYHYMLLNNYEIGLEHFEKMHVLLQNLAPEDFPQKQTCIYHIADAYYKFGEYRKAITYLLEAMAASSVYDRYRYYINTLNTTGLCYQHLDMLNSSDYYFNKTLKKAQAAGDTAWFGIASGNIGYNHFLRKEYEQAIPLFEKDISIAEQYGDWGLAAGSLMPLAAINLEKHNVSLAENQLLLAKKYIEQSEQYKRLEKLYPLLSKLYAAKGNESLTVMYLDSALFVKDSLARKFNLLQMARAKQKVELEQHQHEILLLEAQKKLKTTERNFLIVVVLLLTVVTVMIYRNRQQKYLQKKHALQQAEKELADATQQLRDFTNHIVEKNRQIENLSRLAGVAGKTALQELQQSTILTEAEWEHFKELFEKVHIGFLKRMKEKLPSVTPAEIRFIVLHKLGLSVKEMASVLGIGDVAVRICRSRLRKKLNLHEEGELEKLIESI